MPKPHKIVNCDQAFNEFVGLAHALYEEHKYITFEWRIGADRSLSQNALFHVWLTEYAAHLLNIPKKTVTPDILEGMKKTVKKRFYQETAESFMVHTIIDPWGQERAKKAYTSSSSWKPGEMYQVLNWLQIMAANDGLVLESIGEFSRNKQKQDS